MRCHSVTKLKVLRSSDLIVIPSMMSKIVELVFISIAQLSPAASC